MEFLLSRNDSELASSVAEKVTCDWCEGLAVERYVFFSEQRICNPCYLNIEWVDKLENTELGKDDFPFHLDLEGFKHLRAKCPNSRNGCYQIMTFSDIGKHLYDCIYHAVSCPNKCGTNVKRRLLAKHITTECARNVEDCKYCGEGFMRNQMDHHLKICPDKEEVCTFCGESGIKQKTLAMHHKVCPLMPKSCKMKKLGCSFVGISEILKVHEMSCKEHFRILVDSALDSVEVKDEIMSIQDKVNLLQFDFSQELHDITKFSMELRESVQNLQTDNEKMKKESVSLKETVQNLRKGADVLKEENVVLKKTVQILTQKIEDLKVANTSSKHNADRYSNQSCTVSGWNLNSSERKSEASGNPFNFPTQNLGNAAAYPGMFSTPQIAYPFPTASPLPIQQPNLYDWKWINAPP